MDAWGSGVGGWGLIEAGDGGGGSSRVAEEAEDQVAGADRTLGGAAGVGKQARMCCLNCGNPRPRDAGLRAASQL